MSSRCGPVSNAAEPPLPLMRDLCSGAAGTPWKAGSECDLDTNAGDLGDYFDTLASSRAHALILWAWMWAWSNRP